MAPERIRGGPYRIRSDIWSFGLTICELAIGNFPLTVNTALLWTKQSGGSKKTFLVVHSSDSTFPSICVPLLSSLLLPSLEEIMMTHLVVFCTFCLKWLLLYSF
ncbi:unnamed protein product [Litomosoides sigmodontis]|uniref:mitogen-activated protein kinase kinase n=1 Tax=Litomosoides sigmodontis TaxID=42156 RepID=A0A3P6U8S2_LITSI|nr:unnamed protein product [Litomosoides sigmodontis]